MTAVLVANRGEIACRVIRAAQSVGLTTVAIHSDPDRDAPFVKLADIAIGLGGARASESYLDQDKVLAAAAQSKAELVHPGYGFLAENAGFARRCAEAGLRFVGPTPEVISAMGDKQRARTIAEAANVPVLPGSDKIEADPEAMQAAAAAIGFPLLVKASAGGGGIGMRVVDDPAGLAAAVTSTSAMAMRAFGDGGVYLERFVPRARHVEVQVFGFGDGTAVHLFERDCSLQRRHQKVVEEAPAPRLPAATRDAMTRSAVALAASCRYDGAGTVEFLYDEAGDAFYFLEMNTRIQVEHCVTEMITGVDLVAAQLRHALGQDLRTELAQSTIRADGHAIEARIYAENPARNFMPSPGLITDFSVPCTDHLRVETGVAAGSTISPFYDPMVMKLLARAPDRDQAIERLNAALADLVVKGIATNVDFLRQLVTSAPFRDGKVYTALIADELPALLSQSAT